MRVALILGWEREGKENAEAQRSRQQLAEGSRKLLAGKKQVGR